MKELPTSQFEEAVRPLMEYLGRNWHPHTTALVTASTAELLIGEKAFSTDEYIVD